jgi:hypothetical protein
MKKCWVKYRKIGLTGCRNRKKHKILAKKMQLTLLYMIRGQCFLLCLDWILYMNLLIPERFRGFSSPRTYTTYPTYTTYTTLRKENARNYQNAAYGCFSKKDDWIPTYFSSFLLTYKVYQCQSIPHCFLNIQDKTRL